MDHVLADGVLVDICLGLLPELEVAAASRDMRRACETAAEVLIRQKWSTLADVHVEHTPWRGLAACWARNAAWLRAPQVVAPDRAHVWRDALGRKPQAQARPGAAGGPRAEAEPAPAGLVLEHLDEPIQEGVAVVVASAAGDCTIFDCAATEGAQRLELCHGYPFPATDAAQPRVSLFQPGRGGARATVHRGRTRSTGALRVYTVVLTKRTRGKRAAEQDLGADLFVDGGAPYQTFRLPPVPIPTSVRDATRAQVDGARELEDAPLARSRGFGDRVVLGADHLGRWPLRGAISDFALFRGRVPSAFARGLERALAAKHGIELRGEDAEDSDGAAEEDIDDDFDDDEDA